MDGKEGVTIPRWQYILLVSLLICNSIFLVVDSVVKKPEIKIHFLDERK